MLHSSGGLQHHGGETYLHGLRTAVAPGSRCIDGIGRDAPWAGRRFFNVHFLPEISGFSLLYWLDANNELYEWHSAGAPMLETQVNYKFLRETNRDLN